MAEIKSTKWGTVTSTSYSSNGTVHTTISQNPYQTIKPLAEDDDFNRLAELGAEALEAEMPHAAPSIDDIFPQSTTKVLRKKRAISQCGDAGKTPDISGFWVYIRSSADGTPNDAKLLEVNVNEQAFRWLDDPDTVRQLDQLPKIGLFVLLW